MRAVAVLSLVAVLACGGSGMRAGIVNDSSSRTSAVQEGCDRDMDSPNCGGLGFDNIAIVVGLSALMAALIIPKLRHH